MTDTTEPLRAAQLHAAKRDTRRGDPGGRDARKAFDRLFAVEAPSLFRYLLRRTRSRDDAADLVQEAFLRLFRAVSGQDAPERPGAYLQQIASNLARDHARRAVAHDERRHQPLDEERQSSAQPTPHQFLEFNQTLQQFEGALWQLPSKTRDIFLLHRREGMTYAQIAQDRNISVSSVEKHMMNAIAHLDRALRPRV
jgi:RNA polymerase sigma-70 factor (ECF subfamily)